MDGASRLNLAFLPGMSIAALSVVVDRSSAPMFGTVTLRVKVPVSSTVLTSLSDRIVLVRMSLGSDSAGAAGAWLPQAASRSDATLAIATRLRMKRRVTGSPRKVLAGLATGSWLRKGRAMEAPCQIDGSTDFGR